jgi:geranylgeranyl diphosphate synthase type I
LSGQYQPAIEAKLQQAVDRVNGPGLDELHGMLTYHMGWEGPGAGPEARGKRIRPLLVLLTAAASGGSWQAALPAAAAVELIHNFSLIHDDIEDNSPLRRGRETLWKRWGVPQAINAGDALFTLAHLALLDLEHTANPATALQAARILQAACLHLTQGQYLDLSYEGRGDLTDTAYWPMIGGKTGALLAACTGLGALAAQASELARQAYTHFGRTLGLAFQVQDDLLGIWGDAALTGKSAESDLVSGKKSLPVLIGLGQGGEFAKRWSAGPVSEGEVSELAALLEAEGGRQAAQERANRLTDEALHALDEARPQGETGAALRELALRLLNRQA